MGAHSEKIEAEEIKCKAMAENAQRDLDEALPALEEAMKVILHSCIYYFQYNIIQLSEYVIHNVFIST